ncbi:MAG: hypothetical protein H7Z37_05455, partial [Pyrinomonadaceae bacterium]|nr:hypothetical protein [Pyrinomonadaceae bacterium]
DSQESESYYGLGLVYVARKNLTAARAQYEKLKTLNEETAAKLLDAIGD